MFLPLALILLPLKHINLRYHPITDFAHRNYDFYLICMYSNGLSTTTDGLNVYITKQLVVLMEIDNFSVIYTTQLCPKLSRQKKTREECRRLLRQYRNGSHRYDIGWQNFHLIEVPEVRFHAAYLNTILNLRIQYKIENLFRCAVVFHCRYVPPRRVAEAHERFYIRVTCVTSRKLCKAPWQMQPIRTHS